AKKVRKIIQQTFWNHESQFYSFGKQADGAFNPEKTVLPTVAMHFDLTEAENSEKCLVEYASANFSSDWGTRMVDQNSALYNPSGYHTGSVWPLFTGWVSLAEYKYNRPTQGFIHVMNNLLPYKNWEAGYLEEVLHGEYFQPAGVCAHQAWSESMVLQPILEGMLGLGREARNNHVTLKPAFPPHWKFAAFRNIRVGENQLHLKMKREPHRTTFKFLTNSSKPFHVHFKPTSLLGTNISTIYVANHKVSENVFISKYSDFPALDFSLAKEMIVVINHSGGLGLVPPVPRPRLNQASWGLRVTDETWKDGHYILTIEGKAGHEYHLQIIDYDHIIRSVQNAMIERQEKERLPILVRIAAKASKDSYIRKVIILSTI
ncbi:MAG: amylo-alpha-1,6-glucosidase, partial [bacterium]